MARSVGPRLSPQRSLDPQLGSGSSSIRYGHNGPDVTPGQRINHQLTDTRLQQNVAEGAVAVDQLLASVAVNPQQRDTLISFCSNVGGREPAS